jgi:uncharacterized protein Yka (UPF0111/DUF47 family)
VLYRVEQVAQPARALGECLERAGFEIARALESLDGFEGMEQHRLELHRLENEGDVIHREALGRLFSNSDTPATELVKWKDLYDLLEATMDECEHVANVLNTISIKNA